MLIFVDVFCQQGFVTGLTSTFQQIYTKPQTPLCQLHHTVPICTQGWWFLIFFCQTKPWLPVIDLTEDVRTIDFQLGLFILAYP